jgi:hypothetical protein
MPMEIVTFSLWLFSVAPIFAAGWASDWCFSKGARQASSSAQEAASSSALDSQLVSWERLGTR